MTRPSTPEASGEDGRPERGSLVAQAVGMLVGRVEEQFDDGIDNLSRAITNVVIPLSIGEDLYGENRGKYDFEQMLKVYIYRRVRGLSQAEVVKRLDRQPLPPDSLRLHRRCSAPADAFGNRKRAIHSQNQASSRHRNRGDRTRSRRTKRHRRGTRARSSGTRRRFRDAAHEA
jgi:hypothetical protein